MDPVRWRYGEGTVHPGHGSVVTENVVWTARRNPPDWWVRPRRYNEVRSVADPVWATTWSLPVRSLQWRMEGPS